MRPKESSIWLPFLPRQNNFRKLSNKALKKALGEVNYRNGVSLCALLLLEKLLLCLIDELMKWISTTENNLESGKRRNYT